jgi:dihydrofolate reductase
MQLHQWLLPLKAFRETHGEEGGEMNASTPIAEGILKNAGATIMGRNMFGGGPGAWGEKPWTGYWGDDPPYHHPVFVLTHHARQPLEMQGGTTFHFVTDGIGSPSTRPGPRPATRTSPSAVALLLSSST